MFEDAYSTEFKCFIGAPEGWRKNYRDHAYL